MAGKVSKKLIVCCDGTWMNSDMGWAKDGFFDSGHPQTPSNITRIVRAIKPEDEKSHQPQICYYQNGLGSSGSFTDHILGGGLAIGISENVREAYGFLVNNYCEADSKVKFSGDSIFLLGYSRGAFTTRSVAGLVGGIGLLKKDSMRYFYQIFEDWEGAGDASYKPLLPTYNPDFKITVSPEDATNYVHAYATELRRLKLTREVDITAVGVFDTVGSLGLPITPWLQKLGFPTTIHSYRFFDTGIDNHIANAFQALALDEHRSAFTPTVWERKNNGRTNLKQVWFPGVHSNIGGGADDTEVSDITLAWMMSQLAPFIDFNENYLINQVRLNKESYGQAKWTWGLGAITNSMTFPTNMAGSVTRTPSQYHVTNYNTGKPIPDKLLQNTNEHIHASVRARMLLGGTNYDGKPYASAALADWKLEDRNGAGGKPARWVYEGTNKDGKGKVLVEDELGIFERLALEEDQDTATRLFGTF